MGARTDPDRRPSARAILLGTTPTTNSTGAGEQESRQSGIRARYRDFLLVVAVALCVRLLFAALTHDTYDYDEFVILLLSRDMSHGAVAYRDFMFFHPPGVLVLFAELQPIVSHWWPIARILTMVLDALTAGLVFGLGRHLWGRREGLVAAGIYAISPLALIASTRVNQDTPVTFLGVLGLSILLRTKGRAPALLAGVCFGLALWIKYPAALFLPIYLLASPRRALVWAPSLAVTLVLLFAPFMAQAHTLYDDTVAFQATRWTMPALQRFSTVGLYWLGINLPAVWGLLRRASRPPAWLLAGFLVGGVFALSSQVYYHYFVPMVPFGALLAAPVLAGIASRHRSLSLGVALALVAAWAGCVDLGGPSPLYVTAARLSSIAPTVRLLQRETPPDSAVLADRYEYAYLAGRRALAHYFWNVGVLVNARYLEKHLPASRAVVLSHGASSGYPRGFVQYLDRHFSAREAGTTTIWLTGRK